MSKSPTYLKSSTNSFNSESETEKVSLFSYPFLILIKIYRYTFSPLLGGSCRFYPTCSHYSEDVFKKHGALKGLFLTIKRLSKCHPWNKGGYDPA